MTMADPATRIAGEDIPIAKSVTPYLIKITIEKKEPRQLEPTQVRMRWTTLLSISSLSLPVSQSWLAQNEYLDWKKQSLHYLYRHKPQGQSTGFLPQNVFPQRLFLRTSPLEQISQPACSRRFETEKFQMHLFLQAVSKTSICFNHYD